VATEGSFNNELGLPLTVLRADHKTKYLILEMGARHVGDISHLCSIAQPNIGAVLIVGTAHIEIFGSQAAIAKAKGELITSLRPTGVAVLGNFDPFTPRMADGLGIRSIHFGIESAEDELQVRATDIELRDGMPHFELVTPEARESLTLNFIGEHQVANALAAAAIARAAGISFEKICEGLSMATPSSNFRMQVTEVAGVLIINDSYNANPASMKAAIATLRHFSQARGGESWAFLGRMHELGEDELSDHKMIGELLPHEGIDHLVEIGSWGIAQGVKDSNLEVTQIHETSDRDEASLMFPRIQSGDCVLIKASRAETLEVLATQLINELETRDLKVDQETTTTSKSHEKNKNEEKTL